MPKRDFYDILGVSKTAPAEEIRRAHRKLVRKFHPDVNKDNPAATEKFKEVQEAYDVLSDDAKRASYDQFGHAGMNGVPNGGGGAAGDPFEAFRRAQAGARGGGGGRRSGPVHVEDFDYGSSANMNGGDFSQIFDQMFGGGGRRGRGRQAAPPAARGGDIEHPVALTFEQAARGTSLPLQINRGGKLETIDIKLPPGVKDGSKVRLKGKGEQNGGEPGDLYIVTTVQPHAYFRRTGMDIVLDVPISLYEAMLGVKVEVPTLEGKVTITIPPGTSSGAKLRIKGRGIQRKDQTGDQYAVIKVVVPKNLAEEEMDLVHALEAKRPVDARKDVPWK